MARIRVGDIELEGNSFEECVNAMIWLLQKEEVKESVKMQYLKSNKVGGYII